MQYLWGGVLLIYTVVGILHLGAAARAFRNPTMADLVIENRVYRLRNDIVLMFFYQCISLSALSVAVLAESSILATKQVASFGWLMAGLSFATLSVSDRWAPNVKKAYYFGSCFFWIIFSLKTGE